MNSVSPINLLCIDELALSVYLGATIHERQEKQIVSVSISIWFTSPLETCQTDDLSKTPCYDKLIQHIQRDISEKTFLSIEYLCGYLYRLIHELLRDYDIKLSVTLYKHPKLAYAVKRISFCCSDFKE